MWLQVFYASWLFPFLPATLESGSVPALSVECYEATQARRASDPVDPGVPSLGLTPESDDTQRQLLAETPDCSGNFRAATTFRHCRNVGGKVTPVELGQTASLETAVVRSTCLGADDILGLLWI